MIRVAIASLLARWYRALATSLAVVAGVGVVAGTLMVSDTAERLDLHHEGLDIIRTVLPIAGGVALLVGGFIVNLTLTVTVAQRTRELALLRCLGASAGQIRRMVVLESLMIGVVAALAGLGAGVGVAAALRWLINTEVFPGSLPGTGLVLTPRTVAAALLIGCVVTTVSGWAVARRAGRVAPLAALRDAAAGGLARPSRRRVAAGAVAGLLAVVAIAVAVPGGRGPLLLPAAVLALAGVRLVAPRIVPVLVSTVRWPVAAVMRLPGELGTRNAARHPYRFAAVASALMIGVALISLVTVVLTSVRVAMVSELDRYRADYQLSVDQPDRGLPPELVTALQARPELATVVAERCTAGAVAAGEDILCSADPAGLLAVFDLEVVAGRLADLGSGGIAVRAEQAAAEGWTLGTPVTVHLPGGSRTYPVAAIYRAFNYLGAPLIDPGEYDRLGGDPAASTVYLRMADGVAAAAARAAIDEVVGGVEPAVQVRSRAEVNAAPLAQIDAAAWVYRALTGLAVLIGLSGLVNVLSLSIVERRQELGLLRAVGLDRRQIRAMVRAEAAVIALVGVGAGLGLGLLFGWATTRILEHGSQPIRFTLPTTPLAVIAVAAVVAAIVSAAPPAIWAGRTPVLRGE